MSTPDLIDLRFDFSRYSALSAHLPGVGGCLRETPRDFQVEEVFLYAPSGEGEHLYLWIEKENLTTRRVVEYLRDTLGVSEGAVGVAGMKDRRAVTRQWLSIPRAFASRLSEAEPLPGLSILSLSAHATKLGVGHLSGNQFRILIRRPTGTLEEAKAVLDLLCAQGVPNYYGPQRFGRDGKNAEEGLKLIRAGMGKSKRWRDKLFINSLQSLMFNEWATLRLARGLYDKVLTGDIAEKHSTGGKFQVGDGEVETPRALALEISPTGPMFGKKYHQAHGPARELEDEVLARFGLSREDFFGSPGSRRAIRFPLQDAAIETVPEGFLVSFFLPAGAYATSVLREVMKDAAAEAAEEGS